MYVFLRRYSVPLCVYVFCVFPPESAIASPTEYEVKSAFIYNFTKFIQWPDSSFVNSQAPLSICLVGEKPGLKHFQKLSQKTTRGRRLSVKWMQPTDAASPCHILYFVEPDPDRISTVLKSIQDKPILTIGEYEGFVRHQGIIEFRIDPRGRVRLLIDAERAQRSKIKISAQLLEVASVVNQGEAQ